MALMISKASQAYEALRSASKGLLEGVALGIDPSIGSQSSMPGWSASRQGVLVASGTFDMDASDSLTVRLQRLNYLTRKLVKEYDPDVMVYEMISDVPFK